VSVAADDSRVIAICGETKVDNEEGSWWTMIQGALRLSLGRALAC
jgi:chitin synthase